MAERFELTVQISEDEATALLQLVTRLAVTMPSHLRMLAMDDAERKRMSKALGQLREALIIAESEKPR